MLCNKYRVQSTILLLRMPVNSQVFWSTTFLEKPLSAAYTYTQTHSDWCILAAIDQLITKQATAI